MKFAQNNFEKSQNDLNRFRKYFISLDKYKYIAFPLLFFGDFHNVYLDWQIQLRY